MIHRGNKSVGVESVTSSLTNTQLKEHYANCVKLSAMNVSVCVCGGGECVICEVEDCVILC